MCLQGCAYTVNDPRICMNAVLSCACIVEKSFFFSWSTIFDIYGISNSIVGRTKFPRRSWVKGKVIPEQCVCDIIIYSVRSVGHKCLSSTAKGHAGISGTPGIPGKRGYRVGVEWNVHPLSVLLSVIPLILYWSRHCSVFLTVKDSAWFCVWSIDGTISHR